MCSFLSPCLPQKVTFLTSHLRVSDWQPLTLAVPTSEIPHGRKERSPSSRKIWSLGGKRCLWEARGSFLLLLFTHRAPGAPKLRVQRTKSTMVWKFLHPWERRENKPGLKKLDPPSIPLKLDALRCLRIQQRIFFLGSSTRLSMKVSLVRDPTAGRQLRTIQAANYRKAGAAGFFPRCFRAHCQTT